MVAESIYFIECWFVCNLYLWRKGSLPGQVARKPSVVHSGLFNKQTHTRHYPGYDVPT